MPLPFLAAAGGYDEPVPGTDDALPGRAEDRWRRPYRPGPWRVGAAAVLLVLGSYLLIAAVISGAAGAAHTAGSAAGGAVLLIAWALRLLRAGVWVSPRGLRTIRLLRTTTLPWQRVGSVRTAQQPVRWLGLPRTVQGQALVVRPGGHGEPFVAMTDHDADFLGRVEAFDVAADAVEEWAARHRAEPRRSAG